jgi:thiosulfate reductase cytochrome b subunit
MFRKLAAHAQGLGSRRFSAVPAAAILFLVGHLYLSSMGDKARDLYAAMLDGHHRHRKRETS